MNFQQAKKADNFTLFMSNVSSNDNETLISKYKAIS